MSFSGPGAIGGAASGAPTSRKSSLTEEGKEAISKFVSYVVIEEFRRSSSKRKVNHQVKTAFEENPNDDKKNTASGNDQGEKQDSGDKGNTPDATPDVRIETDSKIPAVEVETIADNGVVKKASTIQPDANFSPNLFKHPASTVLSSILGFTEAAITLDTSQQSFVVDETKLGEYFADLLKESEGQKEGLLQRALTVVQEWEKLERHMIYTSMCMGVPSTSALHVKLRSKSGISEKGVDVPFSTGRHIEKLESTNSSVNVPMSADVSVSVQDRTNASVSAGNATGDGANTSGNVSGLDATSGRPDNNKGKSDDSITKAILREVCRKVLVTLLARFSDDPKVQNQLLEKNFPAFMNVERGNTAMKVELNAAFIAAQSLFTALLPDTFQTESSFRVSSKKLANGEKHLEQKPETRGGLGESVPADATIAVGTR